MHGIIFHEYRFYVNQTKNLNTWMALTEKAGLKGKMYLPVQMYPDNEFEALIQASQQVMEISREELLTSFGRFIIPQFLRIFGQIVKPEWQLMDVLEHTENVIHKTIRQYDKNAHPPYLECERLEKNTVKIKYNSPRNMLSFGKGLVLGLSDHFKEKISITEATENGKKVLYIRN